MRKILDPVRLLIDRLRRSAARVAGSVCEDARQDIGNPNWVRFGHSGDCASCGEKLALKLQAGSIAPPSGYRHLMTLSTLRATWTCESCGGRAKHAEQELVDLTVARLPGGDHCRSCGSAYLKVGEGVDLSAGAFPLLDELTERTDDMPGLLFAIVCSNCALCEVCERPLKSSTFWVGTEQSIDHKEHRDYKGNTFRSEFRKLQCSYAHVDCIGRAVEVARAAPKSTQDQKRGSG